MPPAVTVTEAIPLAHLIAGRAVAMYPEPALEIVNPVTPPLPSAVQVPTNPLPVQPVIPVQSATAAPAFV